MEWSEKNRYNSFNSSKGLAYINRYRLILSWWKGESPLLPPPIEVSLDPIMVCNQKCYYCNSQRYLKEDKLRLAKEEMEDLVNRIAVWGVKGFCLGGGGESLLNPDAWHLFSLAKKQGLESSIITNGTVLGDRVAEELLNCRWVGFSVDASDTETYQKIRGSPLFFQVISHIKHLAEIKSQRGLSRPDIGLKALILPENISSLVSVGELAKSIGVNDFHVRPVDLERKDANFKRLDLDMAFVDGQLRKCHELETDTFRVYTVRHKYDENLHVKHDFKHCIASPLVLQCCTDGNAYVCVDHRMEKRFKLGDWHRTDWWGGIWHRELLQSIIPENECGRCTWSEYQKQIIEVANEDRMCLSFP